MCQRVEASEIDDRHDPTALDVEGAALFSDSLDDECAPEAEWRLEVGGRARKATHEVRVAGSRAEDLDERRHNLEAAAAVTEIERYGRPDQIRAIGCVQGLCEDFEPARL